MVVGVEQEVFKANAGCMKKLAPRILIKVTHDDTSLPQCYTIQQSDVEPLDRATLTRTSKNI